MIYIDQPVGTGFSYGSPLNNMDDAATYFMTFLNNLWDKYPDFEKKPLYFTGEGYAGKYIPRYAWQVLETNNHLGIQRYNLKASLIGDPYIVPLAQRIHMYLLPKALNILDDSNMSQIATLNRRCEQILGSSEAADAEGTCSAIMDYIVGVSGGVFPYDNRIFGYDWDPTESVVTDYFTVSANVTGIY